MFESGPKWWTNWPTFPSLTALRSNLHMGQNSNSTQHWEQPSTENEIYSQIPSCELGPDWHGLQPLRLASGDILTVILCTHRLIQLDQPTVRFCQPGTVSQFPTWGYNTHCHSSCSTHSWTACTGANRGKGPCMYCTGFTDWVSGFTGDYLGYQLVFSTCISNSGEM